MTAPLGIVHLTTFLQGGAGRAITDLATAQHAAGHRVTVVTSATGVAGYGNYPEYLDRLRRAGVGLHTCDSLFTRDRTVNLQVVEYLAAQVKTATVDLVHAHAAVPAFIGLAFAGRSRTRVAVVQTQHGWGMNKTPAQAAFDLDMLRRVALVITTSRATAAQLAKFGVPAAATTVVPCGLPDDGAAPPPVDARERVRAFRERGLPVVGCIGTVNANKNQTLVLDALAGGVSAAAVFVGEGGDALVDEARRRGVADRVAAVGYQPRASRWLPLFDVLAVPSRTEGQGLVVLEAFRAGVPVVASRIPALAELIDDGRTGFLFEADDRDAFCSAIDRVLRLTGGEREALCASARARGEAEFTIEKMSGRYEELYRQVLDAADARRRAEAAERRASTPRRPRAATPAAPEVRRTGRKPRPAAGSGQDGRPAARAKARRYAPRSGRA